MTDEQAEGIISLLEEINARLQDIYNDRFILFGFDKRLSDMENLLNNIANK